MNLPHSLDEWRSQAPDLRAALWKQLGDLPPLFTPTPEVRWTSQRDGYRIEKIAFDNGAGAQVYGFLLIPDGLAGPAPAVLYHHYHWHRYHLGKNELLLDRGVHEAPGAALAHAGFVVLGIDAYGFADRESQGPMGAAEEGPQTELSLFKKFLWEGRSLWGMITRDDRLALNVLLARPEVDPARVGAAGMSLGASRSTWVAALDERIRVVVPIAQLTRYADFAAAGNLALHSIYYYVPGMLASGLDMEALASLTAPRRQHVLIGDRDPLSPLAGIRKIEDYTRQVYALYGAEDRFEITYYPGIAHDYTPAMFQDMLDEFRRELLTPRPAAGDGTP